MLYRKIQEKIINYLKSNSNKIMIIDGARQIGKSFIIRYVCNELFKDKYPNYIEINFVEDSLGPRNFAEAKNKDDFYFKLSMLAGEKMQDKNNTIVFIDEIQEYPWFLTMLKFLKQDDRFTYICSGSLLGVTLLKTPSIPIGSIDVVHMYPLDFEEFLLANGFNNFVISAMKDKFKKLESLDESTHRKVLDLFKKYLLVGGLPDAVNSFLEKINIVQVREIQTIIHDFYGDDASKYDKEHKLKIKRIYDLIPSTLENKKKRIVVQDIENKKGKRFSNYQDEFDYLINSGITLEVKALSNPVFPLIESSGKNLLKLYLNDVGILTNILYKNNINAILNDEKSINLGTVYESVVASELKAHGYNLFYYDNKANGEVDFLIDDYDNLTVLPLEIKSGKNYTIHSAINKFLSNKDYNVQKGYVLSNERIIFQKENIIYLPIYYIMFF
ncbi:MAG: ATP-binding protein [Erysipelotrichaceae bacterium]|nr:ATP-binding protein [Erysipelotrichaceae bacterium]